MLFGLIGQLQKFSETLCELPLQTSTSECESWYILCYVDNKDKDQFWSHSSLRAAWAVSQSWLKPPQQDRRKPALSRSKRGQNCFPGQECHLARSFSMYPASHVLKGIHPFPRQWAHGPLVIDQDTSAGKSGLLRGEKNPTAICLCCTSEWNIKEREKNWWREGLSGGKVIPRAQGQQSKIYCI